MSLSPMTTTKVGLAASWLSSIGIRLGKQPSSLRLEQLQGGVMIDAPPSAWGVFERFRPSTTPAPFDRFLAARPGCEGFLDTAGRQAWDR